MSEPTPAHAALVRSIAARLMAAEHDVARIVDRILIRLERGRAENGDLEIATDRRDWREERAQEFEDALVYTVIEELRRLDSIRARIEAAPEMTPAQRDRQRESYARGELRLRLLGDYSPAEHGASFHMATAPGDAPTSDAPTPWARIFDLAAEISEVEPKSFDVSDVNEEERSA